MHVNEDRYLELVSKNLSGKPFVTKVFLAVDGVTSQKEIGENLGAKQPNVSTAIDYLVGKGLIVSMEQTRDRSPIYGKPRWAKALRIDDYVREKILPKPVLVEPEVIAPSGNPDSQSNT